MAPEKDGRRKTWEDSFDPPTAKKETSTTGEGFLTKIEKIRSSRREKGTLA